MSALTDFSTDTGKVRLLISDIDLTRPIFNDESIAAFLDLAGGSIKRAAASALMVIAVNEVLVQKHIKLLDLQTAGDLVAKELRALAGQYRAEADAEEATAAGSIGWLELPGRIGQFDKRTPEDWGALTGERDTWA